MARGLAAAAGVAGVCAACGGGAAPTTRAPAPAVTVTAPAVDAGYDAGLDAAAPAMTDASSAADVFAPDAAEAAVAAAAPDAAPDDERELLAGAWCGNDEDSGLGPGSIGGRPDLEVGTGRMGTPPPQAHVDIALVSPPASLACAVDACGLREDARGCVAQTHMAQPGSVFLSLAVAADGGLVDVHASGPAGVTECVRAAAANAKLTCAPAGGRVAFGVRIDLVPPPVPAAAGGNPRIRQAGLSVNGRLPPEIIQRIVLQQRGALLQCYQQGLQRNPTLEGRVAVHFLIDRQGAVAFAADGGSDLPDDSVRACVASRFRTLSFPAPQGGTVNVVFGFAFSPGD
jgi:hypothetical protein